MVFIHDGGRLFASLGHPIHDDGLNRKRVRERERGQIGRLGGALLTRHEMYSFNKIAIGEREREGERERGREGAICIDRYIPLWGCWGEMHKRLPTDCSIKALRSTYIWIPFDSLCFHSQGDNKQSSHPVPGCH